jgi:hypothetical protein
MTIVGLIPFSSVSMPVAVAATGRLQTIASIGCLPLASQNVTLADAQHRRTKLLVSSLLASVASSTGDFCFVVIHSLLRINVQLAGSENNSGSTGQSPLTKDGTFADGGHCSAV